MYKFYATITLIVVFLNVFAQNNQSVMQVSLKEAVDYAVKNNNSVKNARLDKKISEAKTNQVGMQGLPQVTGNVDFLHYLNVQNTIIENTPAFARFYNPAVQYGQVATFPLALPNQLLPTLTASQVIFDQSFFTAIKSSKMFQELSTLNINRTSIDVALAVTKAYYGVLVNEKQFEFIENNLRRLDSAYKEAKGRYQNGLARKIEVDRAEVTYNNLQEERLNVFRMIQLSKALLKYQMNLPPETDVTMADSLHENLLNDAILSSSQEKANYNNRIEYSIQQKQSNLNKLDIKNAQSGYYPKLLAIGLLGANPAASDALNIFTQKNRWVPYGYIGLRLQVPITGAFTSRYVVQQKKFEGEKIQNDKSQLERSIDLEVSQSFINLQNTVELLKIQKRNIDLALKNLSVSRAEYMEGIAIALEVTVAESALKEAQTNYYKALYNSLVSKADYDKAMGNLYK